MSNCRETVSFIADKRFSVIGSVVSNDWWLVAYKWWSINHSPSSQAFASHCAAVMPTFASHAHCAATWWIEIDSPFNWIWMFMKDVYVI
jgi:hypothetical protein